jgi:ferredoxin
MVTARIAASPVRGEPAMREPIRLREPGATVDATLALSDPESTLVLASCASPVGVLAVDESACTICGACAASCPTGALALRESDGRIALHHDPALCIGCHRCQVTCPEHALDVRSEIDVPRLWRGSGELMHADPQRCTVCAAALTPPADAPPAQRAARRSGCPAVVVRRLRATRSTPCWPPA